jgi:D-aspartate ligase
MSKAQEASLRTPALVLGDMTLLRPIAMAGVPAILASTDARAPALRSRLAKECLVLPPLAAPTERHALAALLRAGRDAAARTGQRPLFVYGCDRTLAFIYRHRAELGEAFTMLLNDEEVAHSSFDKQRFHDYAVSRGVRVPDTLSADEPLEAAERLGSQVVVKPRSKDAISDIKKDLFGAGKARVLSPRELCRDQALRRHRSRLVVQRLVTGDVDDLYSFHGFASESGELLAWFSGKKLRTHPREGGESTYIELTDDARVAAAGREAARRLGIVGVFKIDMMRDSATGELVTLEVNLRFNLWHYLGAVHGVNIPHAAYQHLVERTAVAPRSYRPRHRWIDMYRDMEAVREQGLPLGAWLKSLAAPKVYETFAWNDPVPAMVWLGETLRQRWKWRASASSAILTATTKP